MLDGSNRKLNTIWVDKGSRFYNRSIKSWLQEQDNDKGIYSTHNKGKSFVAGRFIRTLKNKIYKYMTLISRDKLDEINTTMLLRINTIIYIIWQLKWSLSI